MGVRGAPWWCETMRARQAADRVRCLTWINLFWSEAGRRNCPAYNRTQVMMRATLVRYLLKRLALPLAGLLLFGQVALAAQACMLRAQPGTMQTGSDAMVMDDCIGAPADTTTRLVNCLKAEQPANPSADYHFPVILPPVSAVAELSAQDQLPLAAIPAPILQHAGSPPLQILFCSFQT